MKYGIFFTLAFILIVNTAFATWLGWKQDDGKKEGFVLVYKSEELGSNASSGEDLLQMVLYGDAIIVDYGTKCYILTKELSKTKVRITSGPQAGSIGWVYIECLRE